MIEKRIWGGIPMTLTVLTGEKFLAIITIIHLLLRNGLFKWGRQSHQNVNDKDR